MFTGIIREIGTVEEVERTADGARLRVSAGVADGLGAGDSVSVNGVCLTRHVRRATTPSRPT